jgi:hypothetical protein
MGHSESPAQAVSGSGDDSSEFFELHATTMSALASAPLMNPKTIRCGRFMKTFSASWWESQFVK